MGLSRRRAKQVAKAEQPSPNFSKSKTKPDIGSGFEWGFGVVVGIAVVIAELWFLYFMQTEYEQETDYSKPIKNYVEGIWILIFFGAIFAEAVWDYVGKKGWYRANDTYSSMALGSLMSVSKKVSSLVLGFWPYAWIYENWAIVKWESGGVAWYLMFLGVEFCYYWVHRTGHTVNMFWAMHGVHHSSEEYNLSTAIRQSSLHGFFSFAYYLPLAFFFPPALFNFHAQYNLLYQFWIHTRAVPKLGVLEYFLNTPSQHRVHHGRNNFCIDKNYGGTLCIFDRLFGTFQEEIDDVPICYGLTHSLNTFEPFAANLHGWNNIYMGTQMVSSLKEKLLVFWNGPGKVPGKNEEWPIPPCTRETVQTYNTKLPFSWNVYIVLQMVLTILLQFVVFEFLEAEAGFKFYCFALLSIGGVVLAYYGIGILCNRSKNAFALEVTRNLVALAWIFVGLHLYYHTTDATELLDAFMQHKAVQAYAGITVVSIFLLLVSREHAARPIGEDEIGKDFPEAAAAQQALYDHILKTKGIDLSD